MSNWKEDSWHGRCDLDRRTAGGDHSPETRAFWCRRERAAARQRCSPNGWCSASFDPVDPVDADRMLIVTFTRAAAEEMRERIAVKLRAVQREHPEDSSVARQLILLEKADISTVHAFCQRIVKENFQLQDIQSGFRIADEKELEVWRTEAAGEIPRGGICRRGGEFSLAGGAALGGAQRPRGVTDTCCALRFCAGASVL